MGQEYKKTGLNLVQTNNLPPVPAKNLVYRIINKVIGRFFKSRQLMTSFKTSASFIAQKIASVIEDARHLKVFYQENRFAGWPANNAFGQHR